MARRRLPKILTSEEIDALMRAAIAAVNDARTETKQRAAWRDFVMLHVGLLAGCRVSELCNLRLENIDLDGATIAILHGKGDKDRNVPIGKKLMTILREWIGERKSGYLFPGPKGKRLTERRVQQRFNELGKKAGITKRVHPHRARHSFATMLLRSGADIKEVQDLMGHANLATTAVYLHVDTSRLKAAVDRL